MDRLPLYVLLAIMYTTLIVAIPVVADIGSTSHGTYCFGCHSPANATTTAPYGSPHNITTASDAWTACTTCHSQYSDGNLAATEKHIKPLNAPGCQGCHAILHIGKYNETNRGAWIVFRYPNVNVTGNTTLSTPITWTVNRTLWLEAVNGTGVGIDWTAMEGDVRMIWIGLQSNKNLTAISSSQRYLTCFNCHFLTGNTAEMGMIKVTGGVAKIGIPEFTLRLPPHEITEWRIAEAAEEARRPASPSIVPPGWLGGITILGFAATALVITRFALAVKRS